MKIRILPCKYAGWFTPSTENNFTLSSENNLKRFLHPLQPSENNPEIRGAFAYSRFFSYKNKPEEGLIWDYSLEGGGVWSL